MLTAIALASLAVAQVDTIVVRAGTDADHRELRLTQELRIGELDGPVEQTFGYVDDLALGEDGTLYVPDGQVPAIRIFEPGGRYLGDLGRQGRGPGEFTAVRGVTTLAGGEVAVWHEMDRVTVFGPDREYRRGFSMRLSSIVGGTGQPMFTDSAGNVVVRTTSGVPTRDAPLVIRYAWVRFSPDGEFVDSLLPPDRDVAGPPPAFRTETFTRPSPHGYLVSGRNSRYSILRPLADGRVLRIERTPAPERLSGEERDQWQAYMVAWDRSRRTSSPPLPREKPPWKQLDVDSEGRIWVLRYSEAEHYPEYVGPAVEGGWPNVNWLEPVRHDILDPRGAYLGSVTFPHHAQLMDARGDLVWVLERGEFDEFYIVRYRMTPTPGAD
jgi:hypothetical protein